MTLNMHSKGYVQQTAANITLHGGKLKSFPLTSGTRQQCPLSPFFSIQILEFLARAIRKEEEIKGVQIGKEDIKLFLFAEDIILHLKDPKNSIKKLLDIISTFCKAAEHKINIQKASSFSIYQQ
jgi:hypothetical protein